MINIQSKPIDLAVGWPSLSLLPTQILADATNRVLKNSNVYQPALLYGEDAGYQPLREAIAAWTTEISESRLVTADEICITGGASQNLSCILQVFSDPMFTSCVYMVAPTYHLACRIFEDHGFAGRLRAVPQDAEGIDIAYLEACMQSDQKVAHENCTDAVPDDSRVMLPHEKQRYMKKPNENQKLYRNIIYCVPSFSNPTGRTITLQRRVELVELARRHDALIIADDVYDMLTWSRSPRLPTLVEIDQMLNNVHASEWGNVVSNASFSKILGPGLRTGWARGTPRLVAGLSQCGSTISGGAPSQYVAALLAEALKSGAVKDHLISKVIPIYESRCHVAYEAIKRYLLPRGVTVDTIVEGGFFLYLRLPKQTPADQFVQTAAKLNGGVLVEDGVHFEVAGDEAAVPCNGAFRICFAWEKEHRIVEGIKRLVLTLDYLDNGSPQVSASI